MKNFALFVLLFQHKTVLFALQVSGWVRTMTGTLPGLQRHTVTRYRIGRWNKVSQPFDYYPDALLTELRSHCTCYCLSKHQEASR